MKKIIWLNSYPKSGNTWVRNFIANYFFNDDNTFNPKLINLVPRIIYPKEISDKNNDGKYDLNHISKFWLKTQEKLKIKNNGIAFIKNHTANLKIGENNFTDEKYTLAIIHIIRDPRDLLISAAKYWGLEYNDAINRIFKNKYHLIANQDDKTNIDVISTWQMHYKSWKLSLPKTPKILIKYENLISNPFKEFYKIITFLSSIIKFKIDKNKISVSIENSSFDKLSNFEEKFGYFESSSYDSFFRKGQVGQWKKELTKSQISNIENLCQKEMIELGYL